ncbi:MAG TPA: hypothetical protein VLC98_16000 [Phnomibacter sp.]|nr:hypothetical protein [Phnomibacter sp.]
MKQTGCWLAVGILLFVLHPAAAQNPLSRFSTAWNNAAYKKANTAAKANYLDAKEKQVIYILNLARMNPVLFANTVVPKFPARIGDDNLSKHRDYLSLLATLKKTKPLPILYPDSLCWVSANCHAVSSGEASYEGHDRINIICEEKSHFSAECCHYGYSDALDVVVSLLIDEDVPSLGHREILLMQRLTKVGVAFAPHKEYGVNTVLDFD